MKYQRPDVYELGNAGALVQGDNMSIWLESDFVSVDSVPYVGCYTDGQLGFMDMFWDCVVVGPYY